MSYLNLENEDKKNHPLISYKAILAIVLFFVILALFGIYYAIPKHGEEVIAPRHLEESVSYYISETERRTVEKMTVFYCTENQEKPVYVVRVKLEPKKPDDNDNYRVALAEEIGDVKTKEWKVSSFKDTFRSEITEPCKVQ